MPSTLGMVVAGGVVALAIALILTGLLYQAVGVRRDRRRFPPPGELVDVGGLRLHLRAMGQGSPVVVLESGLAASCISWTPVQQRVATVTRVVSYDRAGLAWSDGARLPRTSGQIARELHTVLARAGLAPPYVLVGHSFGGLVLRSYYRRYPEQVAGFVFVDAAFPHEWLNMPRQRRLLLRGGVLFSRIGGLLAHLGVVRALLDRLAGGSPRAPRAAVALFGSTATRVITGILDEVLKMPAQVRPIIQAHWSRAKSFASLASHLTNLPASAFDASAVTVIRDMPVVAICPADLRPELQREHERLARMSPGGRHLVARTTGHWIQLDDPEFIGSAIKEVVEDVRRRRQPPWPRP